MKYTAASIRARLTNLARNSGVTLPSLIERFAIGRLLWRLDQAGLTDRFVLKGAQLFSLWADTPHRPTRDLDLLSYGDPSEEGIKKLFEDLIATPAEPIDGLQWSGVDVSRSRMKDFYDLHWLSRHMSFDQTALREAVHATFARRGSDLPAETPLALTPEFAQNPTKKTQWNAFLRKGKLEAPPFPEVIASISPFLLPLLDPETGTKTTAVWDPKHGWISPSKPD